MPAREIHWEIEEYEHREKTPDWFWALGITAVAIALVAILFNNLLFAIFIILGAVTLALFALRKPDDLSCAITSRGVRVNSILHPFDSLDSFGIDEDPDPKLLLKSRKFLMPFIVIPISADIVDDIRDILLDHLDEEEHREPSSQKLMEFLGF